METTRFLSSIISDKYTCTCTYVLVEPTTLHNSIIKLQVHMYLYLWNLLHSSIALSGLQVTSTHVYVHVLMEPTTLQLTTCYKYTCTSLYN